MVSPIVSARPERVWKEDQLNKVGLLAAAFLLIALAGTAGATIPDYHTHANYLLASPGAMGVGLYGYVNPALLTYLHQPDLYFAWSDAKDDWSDLAGWGFFSGFPGLNLGFGTIKDETAVGSSYDYRLSFGMGKPASSFGIQYNWSAGSNRTLNRSNFFGIGWLGRPIRYLSIGAVGQWEGQPKPTSMQDILTQLSENPVTKPILEMIPDVLRGLVGGGGDRNSRIVAKVNEMMDAREEQRVEARARMIVEALEGDQPLYMGDKPE